MPEGKGLGKTTISIIPVAAPVFFVFWIVLIIRSFSGEAFKLGDMAERYSR